MNFAFSLIPGPGWHPNVSSKLPSFKPKGAGYLRSVSVNKGSNRLLLYLKNLSNLILFSLSLIFFSNTDIYFGKSSMVRLVVVLWLFPLKVGTSRKLFNVSILLCIPNVVFPILALMMSDSGAS